MIVHLPARFLSDFYLTLAFSSCCHFHFPVFHGFLDKFHDFVDILFIVKQSIIKVCEIISNALL